ncbi:hypothetical protein BKI52_15370 [marine bacterium AO1-C]|nr:hypothetical protein BKI52_15370 [marine bacterium AO1-C]
MQKSISTDNQNEQDAQQQSQPTVQAKAQQGQQTELVNTMFGPKPPIQTKAGRKGPIQAKQKPLQRNKGATSQASQIAQAMGQQYNTDTSQLQFTHNSSFPGTVGADATIQGKNIHFAPGKDTEANIKHEVAHDIINTQRGTPPAAEKMVNGQAINVSDEAKADAMMTAPLQMKASEAESTMLTTPASSTSSNNAPIQRVTQERDASAILERLKAIYTDLEITEDVLWADLERYAANEGQDLSMMDLGDAIEFMVPFLSTHLVTPELRGRAATTLTTTAHLRSLGFSAQDITRIQQNPREMAAYSEQIYLHEHSPVNVNRRRRNAHVQQTITPFQGEERDHLLQRIMAQAALSKQEFDQKLGDLHHQVRQSEIEFAPLKGWARAWEKTEEKYEHNPGKVLDALRGSIIFSNVGHLIHARKHIIPSIFRVVRSKGTIGQSGPENASGYQDMKVNVMLDNGHIAELQLHLHSMVEAKQQAGGHGLYRFIRAGDEEKAYQPEDPGKAIRKLTPVLATLESKNIPRARKTNYIDFIRNLMDRVTAGDAIQLEGRDLDTIKAISRLVYQNAAKEIDKELQQKPNVNRMVQGYNNV